MTVNKTDMVTIEQYNKAFCDKNAAEKIITAFHVQMDVDFLAKQKKNPPKTRPITAERRKQVLHDNDVAEKGIIKFYKQMAPAIDAAIKEAPKTNAESAS